MDLLTLALRKALRANAEAAARGDPGHDPVPVVKFFNPIGAATWLATELHADGDTLFGLADLGFGFPELGYFSPRELVSVRLRYGLSIERDQGFATTLPLSVWADARAKPDRSSGPRTCCATKRAIARTQLPTSFRPPIPGAADARRVSPHLAGPASP